MAIITNKIIYDGLELIYNNENSLICTDNPYNPLNLPPYTIRLLYNDGKTPYFIKGTGVQVSKSPNIWDLTYVNSDWTELLRRNNDLLEVLGANSSGVTNMRAMFDWCISLSTVSLFDTSNVTNMSAMFADCGRVLTSVPLFDTSNVTNMSGMFGYTLYLKSIPLFDTSKLIDMTGMFYHCYNVESGALAFYQQVSTQTNPPPDHGQAFKDCGKDTVTGAAELAQIPDDWK
jgi:surface protein